MDNFDVFAIDVGLLAHFYSAAVRMMKFENEIKNTIYIDDNLIVFRSIGAATDIIVKVKYVISEEYHGKLIDIDMESFGMALSKCEAGAAVFIVQSNGDDIEIAVKTGKDYIYVTE